MGIFATEFRKCRWSTIIAVGIAVAVIAVLFTMQRHEAAALSPAPSNITTSVAQLKGDFAAPGQIETCAQLGLAPGPACRVRDRALQANIGAGQARALQGQIAFLKAQVRNQRWAHIADNPLGAFGVVAGLLSSFLGVVVTAVLVGTIVASEWTGRTTGQVLISEPRRWRVLAAKAVVLAAAVGVVGLIGVVGEIVIGVPVSHFLLHRLSGHSVSVAVVAGASAGQVGRSVLVLALFGAALIAVAVTVRSRTWTLVIAIVGAVVLMLVQAVDNLTTPMAWVGTWMGFNTTANADMFYWPPQPTGTLPNAMLSAVFLIGLLAVAAAGALAVLQRMQIER